MGVSNRYELENKIDKPIDNLFEKKAKEFYIFVENYFKTNFQHGFLEFFMDKVDGFPILVLNSKGRNKQGNDYGFAIFFNTEKHDYIEKNLNKMMLSEEDMNFILNIKDKFINKSKEDNLYFGEIIFKFLNQNNSLNLLKKKEKLIEVKNFGILRECFVLVNDDFIETEGLPFNEHTDKLAHIDFDSYILNKKIEYYESLNEALKNIRQGKMIFNLLHESVNIKEGITSFYIYNEKNDKIIISVNGENKKIIKNINDCYNFFRISEIETTEIKEIEKLKLI